jgi:hypothetical protein
MSQGEVAALHSHARTIARGWKARAASEPHSVMVGKPHLTETGLDELRKQGHEAMIRLDRSAAKYERQQACKAHLLAFFRRFWPW